jgi:hypothetical protein
MEESHGSTHMSRRIRPITQGEDLLFKVILIFNFFMNFISSSLSPVVDHCNATSPNGAHVHHVDIAENRRWAYAYPLALYLIVAALFLVVPLVPVFKMINKGECHCSLPSILNYFATVILVVGGGLYLAGDNILILYGIFDAQIGEIESKDLRSYLVAFALLCMIMNKIIPYIASKISEYENEDSTNNKNSDSETKSSAGELFKIFVELLDYGVMADALYTTIVDEITHQERRQSDGCHCPIQHQAVAFSIFGCLSFMWLVGILLLVLSICWGKGHKARTPFPEPGPIEKTYKRLTTCLLFATMKYILKKPTQNTTEDFKKKRKAPPKS